MSSLLTSCNNTVTEGMVIHTNSPRVRQARRTNVQLILSQHDCRCAVCVRSGNCSLATTGQRHGLHRQSLRRKAGRQAVGTWIFR